MGLNRRGEETVAVTAHSIVDGIALKTGTQKRSPAYRRRVAQKESFV